MLAAVGLSPLSATIQHSVGLHTKTNTSLVRLDRRRQAPVWSNIQQSPSPSPSQAVTVQDQAGGGDDDKNIMIMGVFVSRS